MLHEPTIIESRVAVHNSTGRTASIYGACPWTGAPGDTADDWRIEVRGYTIKHPDGRIGICRKPFETRKEAEEWLEEWRERFAK